MSGTEDPLLSDLCSICHINAPRYRCPRCSTRTCSLPCSRRHKLWSQCSGVRDPAAYLRRNELATEAAFDRDFNFITGIERQIERAERDADNRGVQVDPQRHSYTDVAAVGLEHEVESEGDGARKRKRPNNDGGMVRGEAGFMRAAENAGVKVIRAPKGMTRSKQNGSRWHPKAKNLNWMVEWIMPDGQKRSRHCLESSTVAEAFDRVYPLPKQEKEQKKTEEQQKQSLEEDKGKDSEAVVEPLEGTGPSEETQTPHDATTPPVENESQSADAPNQQSSTNPADITSHRNSFFYLHRPRTATKQIVLIPLSPKTDLTSALRGRTVLEFPTIYVLHESPETLNADSTESRFLLEEEYTRTHPDPEPEIGEVTAEGDTQPLPGSKDLTNIDEKKVLEVLKQDLFEPVPAGETE
ncbi:putative HIT finger domain protein [Aspergillus steynii IBT 23096]|uniref:Box C/D snoRNA protein 1 n=1 Tax=Aspergillus steynii IBT 23096 TaxID=1392250 RepID=A0A2I2FUE0_9EURO|nr:putative HIT finger domain protein [Aspergillus steynii IBT 23096]PLB44186.1 putative HIT finger domain protein [Aspergillus steynii IBT 23096]